MERRVHVHQRTILAAQGNVITASGTAIEVRSEASGQPLLQLYEDLAGLSALGNPFTLADMAALGYADG